MAMERRQPHSNLPVVRLTGIAGKSKKPLVKVVSNRLSDVASESSLTFTSTELARSLSRYLVRPGN